MQVTIKFYSVVEPRLVQIVDKTIVLLKVCQHFSYLFTFQALSNC